MGQPGICVPGEPTPLAARSDSVPQVWYQARGLAVVSAWVGSTLLVAAPQFIQVSFRAHSGGTADAQHG